MKMKKKNSFTIKKYVISLNLYVREIKTGLYKNVTKCVRTNPSTTVLGFVFYLNPSNQILAFRKQKLATHTSKEVKLYELKVRALVELRKLRRCFSFMLFKLWKLTSKNYD